ncbi:MAG TPA: PrsW family glutamic-type intramembrane protease, partial [Aggregatilineales bacterium]|nr:PrsW family glutamic-type intramembrane protease [Aggregatilineales bacterium]
AKALILLYFILQPTFRYVPDGAIYGFAAGIGFAMLENIFYINNQIGGAPSLGIAMSRVLSPSLMHATASASVGISLGQLRRSQSRFKGLWAVGGIALAIALHGLFNFALVELQDSSPLLLLLIAVAIGLGGGGMIALVVSRSLAEEKKRFELVLTSDVGVSRRESRAVQAIGDTGLVAVLTEMRTTFGEDKAAQIERLLLMQANIGILENNLKTDAGPRLRKAWEDEVARLRKESDTLRLEIGFLPMQYIRSVFPTNDPKYANVFNRAIENYDSTAIHTFDLYLAAAQKAETHSAEELARIADSLKTNAFFANVPIADLENLSRSVVRRTFADGQVIFNEGEPGDALYLITGGAIDLLIRVGSEDMLLRTTRAGEVVGDLALLDGQPRSAKARASGAVETLMVRRDLFVRFISSRPQVLLAVLQFLADRIKHATDVVENRIAWAAEVARGNYQQAGTLEALMPAAAVPTSDAVTTAPSRGETPAAAPKRTTATTDAARIGGAFSSLSAKLAQREQEIGKKLDESGMSVSDVADLPADQRTVMTLLLKDPVAALQGMAVAQIQTELPDVTDMPGILAELVKTSWLIQLGAAPHFRYKVNLARKRSRSASRTLTP